jgi:hypothetical protein
VKIQARGVHRASAGATMDHRKHHEEVRMISESSTYTLIHVFLSLIGVFAGLVVVGGLMAGVRFDRWVAFFFVTTVLTNLTGFGFPFKTVTPAHVVGALSLVVLPVAIAALYWKRLDGVW